MNLTKQEALTVAICLGARSGEVADMAKAERERGNDHIADQNDEYSKRLRDLSNKAWAVHATFA